MLTWLLVVTSADDTCGSIVQVQLAGCNTDCGRVEVRLDAAGPWLGLVAREWTLENATLACRAVGFDEAASASAAGLPRRAAIERLMVEAECPAMGCRARTILSSSAAAGVSCRSSGQVVADVDRVARWSERAALRRQRVEDEHFTGLFTDEALERAYVFADEFRDAWRQLNVSVRDKLARFRGGHLPKTTALGVDLREDRELATYLFLETNPHAQFAYETDGLPETGPTHDAVADAIFMDLERDGIALIDDFGLATLDDLERQARDAVRGDVNVSVTSSGAVVTARVELPALEPLLQNKTIARALARYLRGGVRLDGYKATELRTDDADAYIAALWHHDRVGRRIKMFVFVHDVDCDDGHPTRVAKGTNALGYYRTDSFASSRFHDAYVRDTFDIALGCGRRGGGFLFDTHTVHRGTPEGGRDRLTVIAEFHHVDKCPAASALRLGLPCPSGDQFPLARDLATL